LLWSVHYFLLDTGSRQAGEINARDLAIEDMSGAQPAQDLSATLEADPDTGAEPQAITSSLMFFRPVHFRPSSHILAHSGDLQSHDVCVKLFDVTRVQDGCYHLTPTPGTELACASFFRSVS
jgi:hypothetical protein